MPSYTDTTKIGNYLQRALTATETTLAADLIPAASEWIDEYTARGFGPIVITGEQHIVTGPFIYLKRKPVASIQNATLRSPTVNVGITPLIVSQGYELLDASTGKVTIGQQLDFARDNLIVSYNGFIFTFDYTVTAAVPAPITSAATILVSHWLQAPDQKELTSLTLGNASFGFAAQYGVPEMVKTLLSTKRRLVYA